MRIPDGLLWWNDEPGGAEWLQRLPTVVDNCVETWSLRLGAPFEPASVAYVARVTLADGTPAVLKVNKPEAVSEHEPDALAHWAGRGAVHLLAVDRERRALLIEWCRPGGKLSKMPEATSIEVGAEILRRFRRPAPAHATFRRLDEEAERWAEEIPERWERHSRPYERSLLDFAVGQIRDLVGTEHEAVVLHQDLHAGNIIRAQRELWLAIDPKPLVGDPAFDAAPLLRDRRDELRDDTDSLRRVRRRLDALAELIGLDRGRMLGWGVVHALALARGRTPDDDMRIRCARWLAHAS